MIENIKVSVFVLSWNNKDTILECIESARADLQLGEISREIVVVDNGSNDGTEEYATIKNKVNQGISIGKNQGIDACKGKYIIMLDGDVIPVPNSLTLLYHFIEDNPHMMAVGFLPQKWSNQRNKVGQDYHETYCHSIRDAHEIQKACIYYGIFRRSIFDEGLRFDETGPFGKVGYGWEDHDFFMEMKKRGIKQYAVHINDRSGLYFHAVNSSIRAMGRTNYLELYNDREKYYRDKWKEYA